MPCRAAAELAILQSPVLFWKVETHEARQAQELALLEQAIAVPVQHPLGHIELTSLS